MTTPHEPPLSDEELAGWENVAQGHGPGIFRRLLADLKRARAELADETSYHFQARNDANDLARIVADLRAREAKLRGALVLIRDTECPDSMLLSSHMRETARQALAEETPK
jgi:hypothetical protein